MRAFIVFVGQIALFGALVAALLAGVALAAVGDPRWLFLSLGAAVVTVLLALLSTVPPPGRCIEPDAGFQILDEEYGDPVDDRYYLNRRVFGDE